MIATTIFLLESIWPGLAAAAFAGLVAGALSMSTRPSSWLGSAGVLVAGLALVFAAILAVTGAVAGKPGLWLDLAVWLCLAYAAGCLIGTIGRRLARRDRRAAISA